MMGSGGFDFVMTYVQNNPILKDFTFNENPVSSREEISLLCDVIKVHPTLESISMIAGCSGDDITGNEMLCCIIDAGGNKLKQINLSDNSVSTREGVHFSTTSWLQILSCRNLYFVRTTSTMWMQSFLL